MALMSTMEPMGVAIGVAIDEGIAKDVRSTFYRDYNWQSLTMKHINFGEYNVSYFSEPVDNKPHALYVRNIEFKVDGSDHISVSIEADYTDNSLEKTSLKFPNDFSHISAVDGVNLDDIKSSSNKTASLIIQSLDQVIQCIEKKDNCTVFSAN